MNSTASLDTAVTDKPSTKFRVGLVLAILLGLANLPFLLIPTPEGEDGPPMAILVLGAVLGVVSVVAAVLAWRTGSRTAVRVTAACVIVNAIVSVPAFFVDVDPGIKVAVTVSVLLSVLCVVLLFDRSGRAS